MRRVSSRGKTNPTGDLSGLASLIESPDEARCASQAARTAGIWQVETLGPRLAGSWPQARRLKAELRTAAMVAIVTIGRR